MAATKASKLYANLLAAPVPEYPEERGGWPWDRCASYRFRSTGPASGRDHSTPSCCARLRREPAAAVVDPVPARAKWFLRSGADVVLWLLLSPMPGRSETKGRADRRGSGAGQDAAAVSVIEG